MALFERKEAGRPGVAGVPGAGGAPAGIDPNLAAAMLGADPDAPKYGAHTEGVSLSEGEDEQGRGARKIPLVGMFRDAADFGRTTMHHIGREELSRAVEILTRYKQGKANLERRIVEDELWWELRHWEVIRQGKKLGPEPSSAWLFNAIVNKHADAMDNYPEPVVLPRERGDEASAKVLSNVLPVILENNGFEQTYSDNWWEKLKHGTAAYGVFWNNQKENGLGDIDIRELDLLKLFWEPGVTDIQKSRNLFIVELVDTDLLEQQYPQYKGRLGGSVVDVKQYIYDDTVDTQGKSVVVDWYYKTRSPGGKTLLHYVKFVGDTLLYASENDPNYQDRGWYDHGLYPVVLDVLFPEKGTPVGFGYVAICKDPQLYIDKLSANILENSMMGTKKRFFVSANTSVNREQLLDWNEPVVEVEGELDERRLQEITVRPLDGIYFNVLQSKIEEMKDTAANRDVNSGGIGSGVTAASAIAALQEAGNKASRDMIAASYRAHTAVTAMCIELIRQFYDEKRSFRITGDAPGSYEFADMSNAGIQDQLMPAAYPGQEGEPGYSPLYRRPVFDIKIKVQKKNPFSRMEQNERAKELYAAGFFNPERAQEAVGALEMMEFEGKDKVLEQVKRGQTLLNTCQQMSGQMEQMALIIQTLTGKDMGAAKGTAGTQGGPMEDETPAGGPMTGGPMGTSAPTKGGGERFARDTMRAHTPMTGYGERLAKRSTPSLG